MDWNKIDISKLPSPCYIINCDILKHNLGLMQKRCELLNIKPLLAVKGFPLALLFQNIAPFLCGASASSLFEARIGEYIGKEVHIHAPAYRTDEIAEIFTRCDHIVFNSITQWEKYKDTALQYANHASFGIRINPEYSEIAVDKYNPCLPYSRFGVKKANMDINRLTGIEGFHVHVMCDQGAETLARVIDTVINKFGSILPNLSWINLGGGHQLADDDYHFELLQEPLSKLTVDYGLSVYVEPCEAIVTGCGYLLATVLDIVINEKKTAILDTSAVCHMPDVLEMPYRPDIEYPANGDLKPHRYILSGVTCLAGDIIGEYQMANPLHTGDKIIFSDMGAYTFAKENYFNGINLPAIVLYSSEEGFRIVKEFSYQDYETKYC